MSWVVPARAQETLALLDAATAVPGSVSPSAVVEALGALCVAGAPHVAGERARALPAELVERALESLDVSAFCDLLDELCAFLAAEPPEDGALEPSWVELGRSVLDERHRMGLLLRGLALVRASSLVDAGQVGELQEGDERLCRELWRLTVLNDHRRERLAGVAPEERESAWWYSRGAELPAAAVTHLSDVAGVLAVFPEAETELHALREGERVLRAETRRGSAEMVAPPVVAPPVAEAPRAEAGEQRNAACSARPRKLAVAFGTLGAVITVVIVAGGFAYVNASAQAQKEKARLLEEVARLRDEAASQRRLEDALMNKDAMSAAQRRALEAELEKARALAAAAERATGEATPASLRGSSPAPTPRKAPPKSACAPEDPMCVD